MAFFSHLEKSPLAVIFFGHLMEHGSRRSNSGARFGSSLDVRAGERQVDIPHRPPAIVRRPSERITGTIKLAVLKQA